MKRTTTKLRVSLFLSLLATSCAIPSVDVIPRYGRMDVDGDLALGGESADLNAAGLDKGDGYIGLRADLDLGMPVISFSTQTTSQSGSGFLTSAVGTGQGTIPVNTAVVTNFEVGLHNVNVTYDLVPTDFIDVGFGFGLTVIQLDAAISGGGATVTESQTAPLPVLAARVKLDLGDFEATALLTGMDLKVDSVSATLIDLDILAQYHLVGLDSRLNGAIGLGWRSTSLNLEYDEGGDRVALDTVLDGPYVALVFSF